MRAGFALFAASRGESSNSSEEELMSETKLKLSIKDRQAFGVDESYPSAPMKSVFKYASAEDKTAARRFGKTGGFKGSTSKGRKPRRPSLAEWEQ